MLGFFISCTYCHVNILAKGPLYSNFHNVFAAFVVNKNSVLKLLNPTPNYKKTFLGLLVPTPIIVKIMNNVLFLIDNFGLIFYGRNIDISTN